MAVSLETLPLVKELSPRVIRVLGLNPSPMTLQGTNTYIVGTGSSRILIDTGSPDKSDYIKMLKDTLDKYKAELERVIITHWHQDHIGGVKEVWLMNPGCSPILSKLPRPHPVATPPTEYKFEDLSDGQCISTEGATLRVIATPGHTDDHLCLYMEEENAIFSGDCILGQGTTVFEDLKDYMDSLYKIQSSNPSVIYPGHGPVLNDPMTTIHTYITHRQAREKQILKVLEECTKAMTSAEIVEIIYKDTPKELWKAAEANVLLHLKKLSKEKLIKQTDFTRNDIGWSRL